MQLAQHTDVRQSTPAFTPFKRTGASRIRAEARTKILEAARAALVAGSFQSFSMEDVARRAGLTRRSVYNLFVDKNELYRVSRTELIHGLSESVIDTIPPAMTIPDGLRFYLEGAYQLMSDPRNLEIIASIERDDDLQPWLALDYRRYIRTPLLRTCELYILTRTWQRRSESGKALAIAEQLLAIVDAAATGGCATRLHALSPNAPGEGLALAANAYASLVSMAVVPELAR